MAIIERRSPTGDASASFYANRAQALRALGRYAEAMADFERMQRLAKKDNNPSFEVYALAGEALVAANLERLDDARQRLRDADALLRQAALPAQGAPALWLRIAQAAIFQHEGRLAEADRALAEVESLYAQRQAKTGVVAEVGIVRSEIALALGQHDAARSRAEQALAVARNGQGDLPQSFLTGRAWLALARSERALAAPAPARQACQQAIDQLQPTLGAGHPITQQARRLARELGA
jgi:tetratricopeptide (TPR) repeat protein